MKWSESFFFTMKEAPGDAEIISHQLFMRAGIVKKVAPGIFTYTVLGLRAIRKLETIIREELAKINCQEVLMPMVQPRTLWDESGRWPMMTELLKFKNKNEQDFCLGATHEEVISDYVRKDLKSYRDLPISLYQIQTKYRDEIRPRFGLMRAREFIMKDAYTFDNSKENALKSYEKMRIAYNNIFKRIGFEYRMVEADTGAIGGNLSHEFQVLSESGMDKLSVCTQCEYSSNEEITPVHSKPQHNNGEAKSMNKFATPNLKTIADLAVSLKTAESNLVKTFFVKFTEKNKTNFYTLLIPGDREVNLIKVKKALNRNVEPEICTEDEVRQISGASPGSCGPVNFKQATPILMDIALKGKTNMVVGANEDDFHLENVNEGRDFIAKSTADISMVRDGDSCPNCSAPLRSVRGSEVGHIFYLGQKYSTPMDIKYLDPNGKSQIVEMGCYGIGVTRTVQSAIEQMHDKDGMIWPASIAPFVVHMCVLDKDEKMLQFADEIGSAISKNGFDYLIDDRDERPGFKFKDADLMGSPLRITIGKKSFDAGEVEIVWRRTKEVKKVPLAQVQDVVVEACKNFFK
jgi:prolyl-tRNA synthetase